MSAPILIISSPQAASDGSYQQLVTLLSSQGKVELQMIDRIVDGATTLPTDSYNLISILLPAASITSSLIGTLESALLAGGMLEVRGLHASEASAVEGDLKLGGLTQVQLVEGIISCTKPSAVSSAPLSLKRPAASLETISVPLQSALPLRTNTSRAAKASLWAFTTQSATSGSSTPTIDESSLLTAADLERPTLVQREDCDVKKTRKACKNCSCGLKELLLDEEEQDDLVAAGFKDNVKKGTNKDGSRKMKSGVVTSSCGSCYLGDAFRCGSCPYLGMPAFEPGQKVTIDASMDDI